MFSSCKKKILRKNNKFIGEYTFTINKQHYEFNTGTSYEEYTYQGKVLHGSRGYLEINYDHNHTYEFEFDKENNLILYGGKGKLHPNKDIELEYSSGGLGSGTVTKVYGVKN